MQFLLTGGSYNQTVIGRATATNYGYVFAWDTTHVLAGTYTLQSVAYDTHGNRGYSTGIPVTVDNTPPKTKVVLPTAGSTITGTSTLEASAKAFYGVSISEVQFTLTGGSYNKTVIGTATLSGHKYVYAWDSTSVPNGNYKVRSLATDAAGNTTYSDPIKITVEISRSNTSRSNTGRAPTWGHGSAPGWCCP